MELGIGTGRIALPLIGHGVDVRGIDASERMVAKLRSKPGGDAIPVTLGDFADFTLDVKFDLVYAAFNTFFALQSQAAQVQCFRRVATHLETGGAFVIEAFVPDITRFVRGQEAHVNHVEADSVTMSFSRHDAATQRVSTQVVGIDESGIHLYPIQIRYAWPAELDLMAQLAGLTLRTTMERLGRLAIHVFERQSRVDLRAPAPPLTAAHRRLPATPARGCASA